MAGKSRSGFLFILIILILLGIIIYAYKDNFSGVLKAGYSSGRDFYDKYFGKKKKNEQEKTSLTDKINKLNEESKKINEIKNKMKNNLDAMKNDIKEVNENKDKEEQKKEAELQKSDQKRITKETNKNSENEKANSNPNEGKKLNSRKVNVYFTVMQGDERLKLVSASRVISYYDTPLTETIKSLLQGPTRNEESSNIISNIPANTKVLSISIKSSTAYINLSKEFEYNSYGKESILAQLKQIVYTATEFSTVKAVQFLIEGKIKSYLGGDGIPISKPLSRGDLS